MERVLGRVPAVFLTLFSAVAAFVLRTSQLAEAYDTTGKMVAGLGTGPLTWLCVLMVLVFGLYSFFLIPQKKYAVVASDSMGTFVLTTAAAVGTIVG